MDSLNKCGNETKYERIKIRIQKGSITNFHNDFLFLKEQRSITKRGMMTIHRGKSENETIKAATEKIIAVNFEGIFLYMNDSTVTPNIKMRGYVAIVSFNTLYPWKKYFAISNTSIKRKNICPKIK